MAELIPGSMGEKWATETGTANYFKWATIHPSKERLLDHLTVSALGAGTYLGPPDDPTDKLYEQSLLQSGLGGINFFDTSINYRNQRSERVLGKVIKELNLRGILREQIVIATKGGYLPYEGSFEDYIRIHFLDTGVIEMKDIVDESHCMTPSFLENQINMSLKNLGLQCIDLYYLHNPETELVEVGEEEFYRRLREAFILFEHKVSEKKIRRYGIATWNGLRMKKGGLQLSKVIECAKEAGGENHHFKAIQLPYNLVMLEAIKQKKLFQIAQENQISIIISSPLMQGQVKLCKNIFSQFPPAKSTMSQALEFVLSTPQVCSAICGMKKLEHWEENRSLLQTADWPLETWTKATQLIGLSES